MDEREPGERIPGHHRQDPLWPIQRQEAPALAGRAESGTAQPVGARDGQKCHGGDGTPDGSALTVGLAQLAREYLSAKRKQELNHTDDALNWQRTEAHDAFLLALDVAGIEYRDREHGAQIANAMSDLVGLARAFVDADAARWASMVKPPFGDGAGHRRVCHAAHAAWSAWVAALTALGIEVADRRGLAVEVAKR